MLANPSMIFTDNEREAYDILFSVKTAAYPSGWTINQIMVFTTDGCQATIYFDGAQFEQVA